MQSVQSARLGGGDGGGGDREVVVVAVLGVGLGGAFRNLI